MEKKRLNLTWLCSLWSWQVFNTILFFFVTVFGTSVENSIPVDHFPENLLTLLYRSLYSASTTKGEHEAGQ